MHKAQIISGVVSENTAAFFLPVCCSNKSCCLGFSEVLFDACFFFILACLKVSNFLMWGYLLLLSILIVAFSPLPVFSFVFSHGANTVNCPVGPLGIISVMFYPLSFSIQTHRFPSAVKSAEMSLVACHGYWQRPCKTHWVQWSKAPTPDSPPWLLLTGSDVNGVPELSTCLTNTICCLSGAVMQLGPLIQFPDCALDFRQLASL